MCGGCSAFVEARKACQWSARMARESTGSSGFEHEELYLSTVSPTKVIEFCVLYMREPPEAARRAGSKYCGLAGAGLAAFTGGLPLSLSF